MLEIFLKIRLVCAFLNITIEIFLEDDVRQFFKKFGTILDIRHFKAQGYSFVRFDNKDSAAKSIAEMNGADFMCQSIRCSWGKTDVSFIICSTFLNLYLCFSFKLLALQEGLIYEMLVILIQIQLLVHLMLQPLLILQVQQICSNIGIFINNIIAIRNGKSIFFFFLFFILNILKFFLAIGNNNSNNSSPNNNKLNKLRYMHFLFQSDLLLFFCCNSLLVFLYIVDLIMIF